MIIDLLLFLSVSHAQFSEKDVVLKVVEQFPAVQMARKDVDIAKAQELTARGAFDIYVDGSWTDVSGDYEYNFFESQIHKPTAIFGLDLYGGFRESRGNVPAYYGELATLDRGEWNVGAKLPLLRGFWIDTQRATLQKREIQVKEETLQLRATELKEVENALVAYWNWRVAYERWRIQKGLLDIAKTRDQWLEKRSKSGDLANFERKDNLRTILVRQSSVLQSDLDLKTRFAHLQMYFPDPEVRKKMVIPFESSAPPLQWTIPQQMSEYKNDAQILVRKAIDERPEFAIIANQMQQLDIDRELQKNQFLPKLDLKAEYSRDRGVGPSSLDDDNTKVMFNFEVPLQYRRISGQNEAVKAKMQRLESEKKLLELKWTAEIVALQKNLEVAIERRTLSLQEYELAHYLEEGERTRFRHGDTNVLIVNLREQASAEASLRVIETTADVLKAYAALELRLGKVPFL